MLGATLTQLVQNLRYEISASAQPGQGLSVLPKHQYLVRRTQEWFYDDFEWPHLQINVDIPIVIGQEFYSFPTGANMNPQRILEVATYYNSRWYPVEYGIGPPIYNLADPQLGVEQDPIKRWRRYNEQGGPAIGNLTNCTTTNASAIVTFDGSTSLLYSGQGISGPGIPTGATIQSINSLTQITLSQNATATATQITLNVATGPTGAQLGQQMFEIWPVPANTSVLRFRCMQKLPPLIQASDCAVLDDTLIVLTAAGEIMQSTGDKGFQMKQGAAKTRYAALKGNVEDSKTRPMGGYAPPMQEPDGNFNSRWFPLMAKGA